MSSDTDVAFLGQKSVTIDEGILLADLGALFARLGATLHTSMTEGANLSVLRGYKRAGGKPVIHQRGLHDAAPWFLLYGDDGFIDQILLRWPSPKTSNGWQHINGVGQLEDLVAKIRGKVAEGVTA